MKYLMHFALIFTLVIILTSCSGSDDNDSNEVANGSFTAEINGQDYEAEFVDGFIVAANTTISISGSQANGNNVVVNFPIDASSGETFTVSGLEFVGSYDSSNGDATVSSQGSITITEHNSEERTVSGTFSFVSEPFGGGTTYNITNGSFSSSYNEL